MAGTTPCSVLSAYSYGVVADSHRLPEHQMAWFISARRFKVKQAAGIAARIFSCSWSKCGRWDCLDQRTNIRCKNQSAKTRQMWRGSKRKASSIPAFSFSRDCALIIWNRTSQYHPAKHDAIGPNTAKLYTWLHLSSARMTLSAFVSAVPPIFRSNPCCILSNAAITRRAHFLPSGFMVSRYPRASNRQREPPPQVPVPTLAYSQ